MKEILFGWLTKGQYEVSILDGIIFFVELCIVIFIAGAIKELVDKIKSKKKENK